MGITPTARVRKGVPNNSASARMTVQLRWVVDGGQECLGLGLQAFFVQLLHEGTRYLAKNVSNQPHSHLPLPVALRKMVSGDESANLTPTAITKRYVSRK